MAKPVVSPFRTPEGVLAACALFRDLDALGLAELAAHAHRREFGASETIFTVGAEGQSMMALLSGGVRISLPSANGKEMILADLGAGDIFGEIALLDGRERSATATARTDCVMLVLERREVHAFLRKRPDFCLKLIELLCARLRHSDERMSDIAFFDLPARLAKILLTRRGKGAGEEGQVVPHSQSELARMIGARRENINRCLRDWSKQGLIELRAGRVLLLKSDAINAIAGQEF